MEKRDEKKRGVCFYLNVYNNDRIKKKGEEQGRKKTRLVDAYDFV